MFAADFSAVYLAVLGGEAARSGDEGAVNRAGEGPGNAQARVPVPTSWLSGRPSANQASSEQRPDPLGLRLPTTPRGRGWVVSDCGRSGCRAGATGGMPLPEPEATEEQRQRRAGAGIRHGGTAATTNRQRNRIPPSSPVKKSGVSSRSDAQAGERPRERHRGVQGGWGAERIAGWKE